MQLTLLNYLSYKNEQCFSRGIANNYCKVQSKYKNHSFYFTLFYLTGRKTEQRQQVNSSHLFQYLELFPLHHVKMSLYKEKVMLHNLKCNSVRF